MPTRECDVKLQPVYSKMTQENLFPRAYQYGLLRKRNRDGWFAAYDEEMRYLKAELSNGMGFAFRLLDTQTFVDVELTDTGVKVIAGHIEHQGGDSKEDDVPRKICKPQTEFFANYTSVSGFEGFQLGNLKGKDGYSFLECMALVEKEFTLINALVRPSTRNDFEYYITDADLDKDKIIMLHVFIVRPYIHRKFQVKILPNDMENLFTVTPLGKYTAFTGWDKLGAETNIRTKKDLYDWLSKPLPTPIQSQLMDIEQRMDSLRIRLGL